jgi:hypothetical protein
MTRCESHFISRSASFEATALDAEGDLPMTTASVV